MENGNGWPHNFLGQDQIKTGFSCGSSPLICPLDGNTPFRVFRTNIRIGGLSFGPVHIVTGRRPFCRGGDGNNIPDAIRLVITICVLQFKVRLQPFRPQVAIVLGRKQLNFLILLFNLTQPIAVLPIEYRAIISRIEHKNQTDLPTKQRGRK